jgi:hypothetical protein
MRDYDVEGFFCIVPIPVRPLFEARFRSTPSIANIVAPVSVSSQGAEQSTVKYPLIPLPVGLHGTPEISDHTPQTVRICTSLISSKKISMQSMLLQSGKGHLQVGQRIFDLIFSMHLRCFRWFCLYYEFTKTFINKLSVIMRRLLNATIAADISNFTRLCHAPFGDGLH